MTMPPPPPDRMHLQYQPAPPPQPGPQQMGPGGAYGPAQYALEQPVPGQLPVPGSTMSKPGTITGIQVILYIFLAISAVGNVFSIMSMVEFFNPFSLIGLAFAVYSAIQSLASGVQISRGKRWAWIWSLVSAILGLALSLTGFIYGVVMFDAGGDIMLTVAAVLVALYGTLFGLLCSKSARQWILMHRIQRGEVQVPGAAMGGMNGAPGMAMGGMAQQAPAPQRPDTRPAPATVSAAMMGLLSALLAWETYQIVSDTLESIRWSEANGYGGGEGLFGRLFYGAFPQFGHFMTAYVAFLLCAVLTGLLILKGKYGGRVFGLIWTPLAAAAIGYAAVYIYDLYSFYPPVGPNPLRIPLVLTVAMAVLAVAVFVSLLTPGVKAWTPSIPSAPLIMMVPVGQPQAPQQPGPYGRQQGGYPQQQPPYPPQY
ncbi:hypothetical protein O1R50_06785 [Glycomyces luteolus]|uniref:Uncharacterized protein n=1 Tax=Glycomyces luteolus TaxID=2670330 RepID=A0A9X3P736_9ACTN|nr:hypothetical protein [Glycomyces luteolus]MDA1359319.1 hypothetical protein [Glycomyces luteolus]